MSRYGTGPISLFVHHLFNALSQFVYAPRLSLLLYGDNNLDKIYKLGYSLINSQIYMGV